MKVINIEGKELLLYKSFPINVVFLRASYADEYGNCTVHHEIGPIDVTAMAQACRNSGGKVIVQVEKIVATSLNRKREDALRLWINGQH